MLVINAMELKIPTKIQVIRDVIERRGGEVDLRGNCGGEIDIRGNIKYIVKQPKGLHPIDYVRLDFQRGNLVIVTSSVILTQKQAKNFYQQLQIAINVINEVNGLQQVYQNIKERSKKRGAK